MKITIEIDSDSEMDKLSAFFDEFKIDKVKVMSDDDRAIVKGDKALDPKDLFGIWADKPRSIDDVRQDAWQRKHSK